MNFLIFSCRACIDSHAKNSIAILAQVRLRSFLGGTTGQSQAILRRVASYWWQGQSLTRITPIALIGTGTFRAFADWLNPLSL